MPARLSSLLVRDGLVGVKRMEKAFQRQVIYGGSLDTILLEMNLVPEDRLVQYLALASGLPPAARDEGQHLEPAALALVSRELAEQYRAVPVAIEGDAVRVLVCAPLEITELEDFADLLDCPLQPLIAPEYRWNLVYSAAYGLDPPARFTTLARALDVDPGTPAVGRAKTIIVDERAAQSGRASAAPVSAAPVPIPHDATERTPVPRHPRPSSRLDPVPPDAETMRFLTPDRAAAPIEEASQRRRHTILGFKAVRAGGAPDEPIARPGVLSRASTDPSTGIPLPVSAAVTSASHPIVAARPVKRAPTTPIVTEGRDSPLPIVRARELLATAEDRDTVFLTLLRAARSRARWAGLLTVQGGAAIGRVALGEAGLDTMAVNTVLIPLDAVSPFRTVVSNHQSHIGPLVSGDPGIDAMVLRLGGSMPPSALILPIVLRDRVVAIVVAHRVHSDIRLADVTELLPMATAASDALGRLIVKHKAAGYRAATESAIVEIEAELVDTKRMSAIARRPDPTWSAPAPGQAAPLFLNVPSAPGFEQGMELSIDADPPRPIDDLLADIERAAEGQSEDALDEAVERAPETLSALMRRFPGKLRVDRFAVTGRPLRASQYGGLLELVIQLGASAGELLIEKMGAPQRDVRFYATVCTAELRPRNAVFALAERLFDQDFGVRACAIEALAGYPGHELGLALVRARRAVHSTDPEVVGAAAAALVELGDVEAVVDLIGVIERADRGGDHARRALIALTAQDFGASERKWRKWYDGARTRHRIEWLIEGLGHKDDAIRETAISDLRRLTGEYFGYHHDLPRKERDAAADRWAAWWRDAGHRRFSSAGATENERHRPTAEIPIRRD